MYLTGALIMVFNLWMTVTRRRRAQAGRRSRRRRPIRAE